MNRAKPITVAALLLCVLGMLTLLSATRILAAGSAGLPPQPGAESVGGPPSWAGLLFMVLGVAKLFGVFGLWQNQKWGKIVAIVTCAIGGLFALGDVLGSIVQQHYIIGVGFALATCMYVTIIVLVLKREPRVLPT